MRRPFTLCLLLSALARPAASQTSTTMVVGGTWLDFGSYFGSFAAATGQLRVQRSVLELSTFGVMPLEGASAVADCLLDAPCFERKTPDALFGALLSRVIGPSPNGWRGSIGAGYLGTTGMEWSGHHSSPAGALGLDWASPRRTGLTFTLGVRAIGLTSKVGGLRYMVLPALGITF